MSVPLGEARERPVASSARASVLALGGAALCYAIGFLLWYGATPLGRAPVLDGREVIDLAQAMADGSLPAEPFYRAPLYPAILALALDLGVGADWLPALARGLNLLAHCAAALALATITRRLGGSLPAALAAFVLWTVYPVALHLAGDPIDITLALALTLWSVALALPLILASGGGARAGLDGVSLRALAAGTLGGLAIVARPNFLPVVAGLAVLTLWFRSRSLKDGIALAVAAMLVTLGPAAINQVRAGEFRVLPWQGAYNLWAANRPESNGRYYEQMLEVRNLEHHVNPARAESELLYQKETGERSPLSIDAMNRHWRERFLARIAADPVSWLSLVGRRGYYLLNNVEQFDNKTYAFHKSASPWLRWNPLGFGLIFAAAAAALAARRPDRGIALWLGLTACYLAGALLFYASDRFRLPVAAMLVPLAVMAPERLLAKDTARGRGDSRPDGVPAGAANGTAALLVGALAALLSFWPQPRAERGATFHHDLQLEAHAANDVGDYGASERLALEALARDARPSYGWELLCTARYNMLLSQLPGPVAPGLEHDALDACFNPAVRADRTLALGGVFLWRSGAHAQALALWQGYAGSDSPARYDAMAFVALARGDVADPLPGDRASLQSPLLTLMRGLRGDRDALAALPAGTNLARESARLAALLPDSRSPEGR